MDRAVKSIPTKGVLTKTTQWIAYWWDTWSGCATKPLTTVVFGKKSHTQTHILHVG